MSKEGFWGLVKDWGLAFSLTAAALLAWRMLAPGLVTEGVAPELELPNVDGSTYVLADRKAPVYVINFWATWCGPCRTEIPALAAYTLANPEVELIGVSVDAELSTKALGIASERLGIRYPVVHDLRSQAASAWGVHSYPTTFVLDADKHIVGVHQGAIGRHELDALVARARE